MTDARFRGFWHRSGPLAVLAMLAVAATSEGCSCSDDTQDTTSTSGPGSGGSGGSGGGMGGMGGMGGTVQAGIDPAAQDVSNPLDATPDPNGQTIYFTAMDPMQGTGVYKVPASGGPSTVVAVGDPFVAPFGIAIASTGQQLYITDPASEFGPNDLEDAGQIFVLSVAGGTPSTLTGSEGTKPRGIEVLLESDFDTLFFTGQDASGAVGVFKISPTGGTPAAVATGAPFVDPSGIAITSAGAVYVADTISSTSRQATILTIPAGGNAATEFVGPLDVGYPVGIALNHAETQLLVSGLDPVTLTDLVIIIDLVTRQQTFYVGDADTNISAFEEPAGLHRARNADIFAWADSKAGANGTVYTINF